MTTPIPLTRYTASIEKVNAHVELLQAQLDEMKKQALKEDFNFEEVKKAADLLAEAKRKRNLLREPVSEDEVIAALGDAAGLWEFMFPGARHELLQLIVGDIVVYPDRISFVLKVDGLKDLASEDRKGPSGSPTCSTFYKDFQ